MSKSKLTLLIDGNWLLISRLSVLINRYDNDIELCHHLQLLLIKSIKLVLRQFPQIDNIIFMADGGSWRSTIEIPDYLIDEDGKKITYKGNREYSTDINWDVIFSSYEEFISILQQHNINAYREQTVEGDDWAWWWSTYLNSQGTNCIIWTKDNDLKQLVNIDNNKCFTVWWNKDTGIFCDEFDDNNLDFLFNNEYNENDSIFRQIISNEEIHKLNKNEIIIDKIIRGDLGDNILPIAFRSTKNVNNAKKFRIAPKDIDYTIDFNNDNIVYDYLRTLYAQRKYANKMSVPIDIAFDHFKYNRKLVALEKQSYPESILEIFNKYKDYSINKDIGIVENYIQASSNSLGGILEII